MDYDMDGQSLIPGRMVRDANFQNTAQGSTEAKPAQTNREISLNGTLSWAKGS
jgi:hypothetical protein